MTEVLAIVYRDINVLMWCASLRNKSLITQVLNFSKNFGEKKM